MTKPLSVAKADFTQNLTDCINNSGLPACILVDVVQGAYQQLQIIAQNDLERDRAEYNKSQEESVNGLPKKLQQSKLAESSK